MGEMQEKLHIRLTADICLWYDDIVEALCEGGPLFCVMELDRRAVGAELNMDEYRATVAYT